VGDQGPADRVAGLPPPRLREDPALADELLARLPDGPWSRATSVTDLVDPRRSYWRQTRGAPPISPDRQAKMDAGRRAHRRIDLALPAEGAFEVRLRRGGVSARIDLLADVPVEVKTGDDAPPDDLVEGRPEYVDQVAMYCALLDRTDGRLIHVHPDASGRPTVRAVDVAFADPAVLRDELASRASGLRSALASADPAGLPACRWFARGCEFRAAGRCECNGAEPFPSTAFQDAVVGVVVRGDVEERWNRALAASSAPLADASFRRFRDLLYPRRTYFETTSPEEPPVPARPSPGETYPSEVYDSTVGALEGGPIGDVRRLAETDSLVEEEVAGWKGEPYVIRTSRAWSRARADAALERFPQYAIELGFRCAVTATTRARVVLAYERAENPRDRLQVLEYDFGDGVASYAQLYRDRAATLTAARARADPRELPPCALWMTTDCPYRARCGCPAESGRSQR
jgi:hypothetical protein